MLFVVEWLDMNDERMMQRKVWGAQGGVEDGHGHVDGGGSGASAGRSSLAVQTLLSSPSTNSPEKRLGDRCHQVVKVTLPLSSSGQLADLS